MKFDELRDHVKNVRFDELRMDSDNYFEAVVIREELNKLTTRLESFFGNPAWPSSNRLSFQMQEVIKGFGGIMQGQTLYFWNERNEIIFAMLWPWKDGERTTVKIIQR